MNLIRGFFAFWYDFIVGDDWFVAAGVVVLLAATRALVQANLNTTAALTMTLGAALVLAISLRRATASEPSRLER
jgi:membrane protein implicated in regulation of membrane protease activity